MLNITARFLPLAAVLAWAACAAPPAQPVLRISSDAAARQLLTSIHDDNQPTAYLCKEAQISEAGLQAIRRLEVQRAAIEGGFVDKRPTFFARGPSGISVWLDARQGCVVQAFTDGAPTSDATKATHENVDDVTTPRAPVEAPVSEPISL